MTMNMSETEAKGLGYKFKIPDAFEGKSVTKDSMHSETTKVNIFLLFKTVE